MSAAVSAEVQPQAANSDQAIDLFETQSCEAAANPVWIVPNSHGTATGWLTGFAHERNYMVNNYGSLLEAQENVGYPFSFSEVPTAIAMKELAPADFKRFRAALGTGKVSIANAFMLEFEPSLVQAATIMRMGRSGAGWFEDVLGIRPDNAWFIDVLGVTPNMAEYLDLLDIRTMMHVRNAETRDQLYYLQAISGARITVASMNNYAQWRISYRETGPLPQHWREHMMRELYPEIPYQPEIPFVWPIGAGDYSAKPEDPQRLQEMTREVTDQTSRASCLGTLNDYWDSVFSSDLDQDELETITTPSLFAYNAFWGNLPQVKQGFRATESRLVATEIAASLQSLERADNYPAQRLDDIWWLLLLNADRALQWGAGAGDAFQGDGDWNYTDRDRSANERLDEMHDYFGHGYAFDPVAWRREYPFFWAATQTRPANSVCEASMLEDGVWCQGKLEAMGTVELESAAHELPMEEPFDGTVETDSLKVEFDLRSGDIVSLQSDGMVKLIEGRLNELVWYADHQTPEQNFSPTDLLAPRTGREVIGRTSEIEAEFKQYRGNVYTMVQVTSVADDGSHFERFVFIPHTGDQLRFQTVSKNVPYGRMLVARHDLEEPIEKSIRGTPFGYDRDRPRTGRGMEDVRASHDHLYLGLNETIAPASLWSSHHLENDRGIVLLDQGLSGREWGETFVDHFLMNAQPHYRGKENELYSGMPERTFNYAIIASTGEDVARSARAAKEGVYPLMETGRLRRGIEVSDTIVVETVARTKNEIRVLAQNYSSTETRATIRIPWPHISANLTGSEAMQDGELVPQTENSTAALYAFAVAPGDAFELVLKTLEPVAEVAIREGWEDLVPPSKLHRLSFRDTSLLGHPPE
ncbi:glycoside hydrolase family 38 N-terminal domain-containing protein [Henriciella barbarensis]|uniref:glycoside hydrolase family 38 N-terminal domain-containing protein n=1 Tax=Henriciella barbarensis TaxID=86342 RepID=UPI0015FD8D44|nr:hypothetical protein [Henriciella barbarensis]